MRKAMFFPLLLGIAGTALLLWLGVWQVQRLAWKENVLAQIDARITDVPVALPASPDPVADRFLRVSISGDFTGPEIHVLASRKLKGAGYKIIQAFQTDTRTILVDRGFIATPAKDAPRMSPRITIVGNLHWPDEIDSYTPADDLAANIWFARDVPKLAQVLQTEPLLLIASSDTGAGIEAYPVDSSSIPNDHLNYAITWFLMAAVWFGMTVFLLLRIKRQSN